MKSRVDYLQDFPSIDKIAEVLGFTPEKILWIADRRILKHQVCRRILREQPYVYPVKAGEGLKSLDALSGHVKKILRLLDSSSINSLCLVGVGGGSVGDFVGFLASILKRGVPVIHVPTTLLAALDSAHGGKTALNVAEFKNQVGSFYPAAAVLIVSTLLKNLPPLQLRSAAGELAKIAIIEGGSLFESMQTSFRLEFNSFWQFLPSAVTAKYRIVDQDPDEKTGHRQILNLGHSLGHVLESYYEIPHGVAVGLGLDFALRWSHHHGFITQTNLNTVCEFLHKIMGQELTSSFMKKNKSLSRRKLYKFISEDKKMAGKNSLHFVFVERPGSVFRKLVAVDSFVNEAQRQGWAR